LSAAVPASIGHINIQGSLILGHLLDGLPSGEVLRQRKGAMATWWDEEILPVGRLQDGVDACVG
jgi:hypothetical protein